jgi:hypothetical protein
MMRQTCLVVSDHSAGRIESTMLGVQFLRKLLVLVLGLSSIATAGTILSVTNANGYGWAPSINSTQYLAAGFTLGAAYTNVSISANVVSGSGSNQTSTAVAFLSSGLGVGATTVASTTFTAPASYLWPTMFSNLSLGPGTYYLILLGDANNPGGAWEMEGDIVTSDYGEGPPSAFQSSVTNPADPPGATWIPFPIPNVGQFQFAVTGTPSATSATPEPTSAILLGTGLAALVLAHRRRKCR